jgi:hypothetical protein
MKRMFFHAFVCVGLAVSLVHLASIACVGGENMHTTSDIAEVLEAHRERLLSLRGVVGIGEGSCGGTACIHVYVVEKTPQLEEAIRDALGGHEVIVKVTGKIRAHPSK